MTRIPEQLKILLQLNLNDDYARYCLEAISINSLEYQNIEPMSSKHVLSTYEIRAKANDKLNGKTQGYAELLQNLRSEQQDKITIHVLKDSEQRMLFLLFTDEDLSKLLGVLVVANENSGNYLLP